MNVSELMTTAVKSCDAHDTLERAAQIMWENDCGVVPVVDRQGYPVGMITDRDICMATYTRGQTLSEIPVSDAMAKKVFSVRETDRIDAAETVMQSARVRRVPVLDVAGHVKGILSMSDLARYIQRSAGRKANGLSGGSVAMTLAAICEPYAGSKASKMQDSRSAKSLTREA